jgi:hypothetical protein
VCNYLKMGIYQPCHRDITGFFQWRYSETLTECTRPRIIRNVNMFLGVSEKYVYPQDIVIQIGNFMFRTSGWNGVPYFQTNPFLINEKITYHNLAISYC